LCNNEWEINKQKTMRVLFLLGKQTPATLAPIIE